MQLQSRMSILHVFIGSVFVLYCIYRSIFTSFYISILMIKYIYIYSYIYIYLHIFINKYIYIYWFGFFRLSGTEGVLSPLVLACFDLLAGGTTSS